MTMASASDHIMKPMSVKEIVAKAQAFEFNPHIALKYWLRTADTLLKEAQIYEREDNYQQAYLLLMRYATLVADKLSQHPGARDAENKKGLRATTLAIPGVVSRLEVLKPKIESRYDTWLKSSSKRKESSEAISTDRGRQPPPDPINVAESDPAIAGNSSTIAAAENRELAVELAHKEIRRRDAARKATLHAGISEEEHQRRSAGLWNDWESGLSGDGRSGDDVDMRQRMEDSRRRLEGSHDIRPDFVRNRSSQVIQPVNRATQAAIPGTEYHYPSVFKSQPLQYGQRQSRSRTPLERNYLPPVPIKERQYDLELHDEEAPVRPEKQYDLDAYDEEVPARPEKQPIYETPSLTPSPVEATPSFTFRPSAYLENGAPLRTVWLPPDLRERFLSIAAPNTRANLETCGILCGTLISNALFISRLVIPEQESTSDTCETVNESALFDYCDSEDLMVLGWIHTHPTQTCFMSSRDLHTHCGYQVMMPESIAIVCAPSKHPSWGVFRLTDPPGMQSVLKCQQTGLFHPHAEPNIYTDALRPGHVFEAKGLKYEVVDLRPGY